MMNRQQHTVFSLKRSRGVTLVELMIAMVISTIVLLGVATVYSSTKRSYKAPWDLAKTMDFFEAQSGRAFEPEVLDIFLRLLEQHGDDWLDAPRRDHAAAGLPDPTHRN